jgi:hexulose-6-phosphate isomerase
MSALTRRELIQMTGGAMAAAALPGRRAVAAAAPAQSAAPAPVLKMAVILSMVRPSNAPVGERFAILKRAGFDGVEISDADPAPLADMLRARDETGIRIHGVIDPVHWKLRLSDPDPGVRAKGLAGLEAAIRQAHAYGGTEVLLVPGEVTGENETHQQVWDRSTAEIRKVLGLAATLGVRICIENVSNSFLYDPKGGSTQKPDQFIAYIDQFKSPWVGLYYDIGNHMVFGDPGTWIRALGPRIVKLHIKDRIRAKNSTADVGAGDVDWGGVRAALRDIGFNGWCTAEVSGGDEARLTALRGQMQKALVG